jgi:hypothetical protein
METVEKIERKGNYLLKIEKDGEGKGTDTK